MEIQIKRGFTILELLVVIAIMALLSSIILVSLNNAKNLAREAASKESAGMVHRVLGPYEQGEYIGTINGNVLVDSSEAKHNLNGVVGYVNDPNGFSGTGFTANDVVGSTLGAGTVKLISGSLVVEGWIKPASILECDFSVFGTQAGDIQYLWNGSMGKYIWYPRVYVNNSGVRTACEIKAVPNLMIGQWNYFMMSYDSSKGILTFNENNKTYTASCGGPYKLFDMGSSIPVGGGLIYPTNHISCQFSLDELRVYDHSTDL